MGAQKTISSYSFDRIVLIFGYIVELTLVGLVARFSVSLLLGFRVRVMVRVSVRVSLVRLVSGSSLLGLCVAIC